MKDFKVGMRVRYKPKSFIQTLPEQYRSLSVAYDAVRDFDILDFIITEVHPCCYDSGDERSRIVCIKSTKHHRAYNTLAIFLTPQNTTIKEGDIL